MTPAQYRLVKEVVEKALAFQGADRNAYLNDVFQSDPMIEEDVRSHLLACERSEGFLEERASPDPMIGCQLGPYRIDGVIGEGGMGTVYRASRDDGHFRMQAAIKVVRRGLDSYAIDKRFRNERQILARLSHPGVARLLDGGVTHDGRPYFVMEFVEGRRLDEAARDLGLNERLDLFRSICKAVHYAHQNLVVHGDLKSSNILVLSDGTPKLLDFGIARLLETEATLSGVTITAMPAGFTPAYASPEQLRGEPLTTASDVYSLGVLLCELLTGKRPYQFSSPQPEAILNVMKARQPARPSELIGDVQLRGDLDNIVLKALQNEPTWRYSSAEQMGDDVRRYRTGMPVLARPDSLSYRASKFVHRHRFSVAAGAFALIALVAGFGAAAWQARAAHQEKERAERRFNDVRHLANAFIFELERDIAALPGSTEVRGKLIARATDYLDRLGHESDGTPELRREIAGAYQKLGDVQGRPAGTNLGDTAGALASYGKALAIRDSLMQSHPQDVQAKRDYAESCVRYSAVLKVKGDYRTALDWDRKALAVREDLLRGDPENRALLNAVASSYTALGGSLSQLGDWPAVLRARRRAYDIYERLAARNPSEDDQKGLALAALRLASILLHEGDRTAALDYNRKALAIFSGVLRGKPNDREAKLNVAGAQSALGGALTDTGDLAQAVSVLQQVIRSYEALTKEEPHDARSRSLLSSAHYRLGEALVRAGAAARGLISLEQSRQLREDLAQRDPLSAGAQGQVAEVYAAFGGAYTAMGRRGQALDYYHRALEITADLEKRGQANAHIKTVQETARTAAARLRSP